MIRHRLVLGVVAAGCAALAAGAASAEEDMKKDKTQWRVEKLTKVLELTPEQQAQVQQISDDYQARRTAIKDQLEALRQEEDAAVKALLTPDQQARFDRWQQRKEERRKERMERRQDKKDRESRGGAPDDGEGR